MEVKEIAERKEFVMYNIYLHSRIHSITHLVEIQFESLLIRLFLFVYISPHMNIMLTVTKLVKIFRKQL